MDFMATKGTEYLLILGYLALLVPFWMVLHRRRPVPAEARRSAPARLGHWFAVPDGFHFHPGHTWAAPDEGDVVRVGLDDFATHMLGTPSALRLPQRGWQLAEGEVGFTVDVAGESVNVLSPVRGEVVEVNEAAVRSPETVSADPYGRGWLMKVRVPRASASFRNLLSGALARAWMNITEQRLNTIMGGELGTVMPDGGVPVAGFVRELAQEGWREVAAEMLLTE